MSDIRIKMAKDLRDMSDMVGDLHWMAAKAVEDLTKKEGEIAKRDARIVELEGDLKCAHSMLAEVSKAGMALRAELAAIKAQEPVAWAGVIEDCASLFVTEPQLWKAIPLYAAPVSEAKAKGVVQWPDADEIMQMAFEEGQPADDASGYCFELEEFDLFIERLMSEVARLNATHVQQPKCKTCDDNGRIGGPSFYAPDEGGEPCPDCSAPVQQVSVPDVSAMARILADRNADACNVNREDNWAIYGQDYIDDVTAMIYAAPAAPAADAGDVLDQAMYTLISIGYHENSGLVHELRQALAAHRAKGVV